MRHTTHVQFVALPLTEVTSTKRESSPKGWPKCEKLQRFSLTMLNGYLLWIVYLHRYCGQIVSEPNGSATSNAAAVHKHLTNHSYFDRRKNLPQLESHARIKGVQILKSVVYLQMKPINKT